MRDGRLLSAVKWLARTRFWLDLAAVRALRRRRGLPLFDLGGECRRCARCCEAPAIHANAWVWHLPRARSLFLWWQRVVNGFELVRADRPERTFVFRCTHFDSTTRRCDSYASRRAPWRGWPRPGATRSTPSIPAANTSAFPGADGVWTDPRALPVERPAAAVFAVVATQGQWDEEAVLAALSQGASGYCFT